MHRLVVLIAGNVGLLALVAGHAHDISTQQHCEPVVRR
jgi:hypothetical protein